MLAWRRICLYLRRETLGGHLSLLLTAVWSLGAQSVGYRVPKGFPMYYEVHDGDTTFFDNLEPIWVFPRSRSYLNR